MTPATIAKLATLNNKHLKHTTAASFADSFAYFYCMMRETLGSFAKLLLNVYKTYLKKKNYHTKFWTHL